MGFNTKAITKITSSLLLITGLSMILPIIASLYYHEEGTLTAFIISMGFSLTIGAVGFFSERKIDTNLKIRDVYMLVIMAWLACALIGAIPYFLTEQVDGFIDAFFESTSGYTTTGATSTSAYSFSNSVILWKAITHWLGGMGILVFMIALLPALGVEGQRIAAVETPGPDLSKLAPRAKDIGKYLYSIYIVLTIIEFLFLFASPKMSFFEALINTMGTISTAGLFLHPEGISFYGSLYVELVIAFATIFSSMNYVLYISLVKREFNNIKQNLEIKVYVAVLVLATALVTISLFIDNTYQTFASCLRHAFFQSTAFLSTTGFSLDDYTNWPAFTTMVFIVLLFIGGCASSTSGGIKVSRFAVMLKIIHDDIRKKIHPNMVTSLKMGNEKINVFGAESIMSFIVLYFMTFLAGALVISLDGNTLEETLSATASLMSTTGLYFGDQGATGNYEIFSAPIRLFMSVLMVVGRLELYSIFMLLTRGFWNPDKSN